MKFSYLEVIVDWFRRYKVFDGKLENEFVFNVEFKDEEFVVDIIRNIYDFWKEWVVKKIDGKGIGCIIMLESFLSVVLMLLKLLWIFCYYYVNLFIIDR